jgi:hypothetical protein
MHVAHWANRIAAPFQLCPTLASHRAALVSFPIRMYRVPTLQEDELFCGCRAGVGGKQNTNPDGWVRDKRGTW